MDTFRKVWTLWPDLDEMAADLNEGVSLLKRLKKQGVLPDKIHDHGLLRRALMTGKKLGADDLREERRYPISRRREDMVRFFAAVGGTSVVAARLGIADLSRIRQMKRRGYLPRQLRPEFEEMARGANWPLPERLFTEATCPISRTTT